MRDTVAYASTLAVFVLTAVPAWGADNRSALHQAGCVLRPAEDWPVVQSGAAGRKPVVFGTAYTAPALTFRIVDTKGQPPQGARITLKYIWHWLEYPYPEHPFGVISDDWDVVECPVAQDAVTYVPEFVVKARGWYSGAFLRSVLPPWKKKMPEFYQVEIVVLGSCGRGHVLDRQQLEEYRTNPKAVELVCRQFGKH